MKKKSSLEEIMRRDFSNLLEEWTAKDCQVIYEINDKKYKDDLPRWAFIVCKLWEEIMAPLKDEEEPSSYSDELWAALTYYFEARLSKLFRINDPDFVFTSSKDEDETLLVYVEYY